MNRTGWHAAPNGWQKVATVTKKKQQPLTVVAGRVARRQVAPTSFRKVGSPNRQAMATLNGDGRWRAAVVSVWSWAGDELGRERTVSRSSFDTSTEAHEYGAKMLARLDRARVDRDTARITTRIRQAMGQARSRQATSRLFASNGRRVIA